MESKLPKTGTLKEVAHRINVVNIVQGLGWVGLGGGGEIDNVSNIPSLSALFGPTEIRK